MRRPLDYVPTKPLSAKPRKSTKPESFSTLPEDYPPFVSGDLPSNKPTSYAVRTAASRYSQGDSDSEEEGPMSARESGWKR